MDGLARRRRRQDHAGQRHPHAPPRPASRRPIASDGAGAASSARRRPASATGRRSSPDGGPTAHLRRARRGERRRRRVAGGRRASARATVVALDRAVRRRLRRRLRRRRQARRRRRRASTPGWRRPSRRRCSTGSPPTVVLVDGEVAGLAADGAPAASLADVPDRRSASGRRHRVHVGHHRRAQGRGVPRAPARRHRRHRPRRPAPTSWGGGGPMLASTQFAHIGVQHQAAVVPAHRRHASTSSAGGGPPTRCASSPSERMPSIGGVAAQVGLLLRAPSFDAPRPVGASQTIVVGAGASPAGAGGRGPPPLRRGLLDPLLVDRVGRRAAPAPRSTPTTTRRCTRVGRPRPGVEVARSTPATSASSSCGRRR